MKSLKFLVLIASLIGFLSCNKDKTEELNNIDVEKYIVLLKANQYDSLELPAFTHNDIPALLKYRNEIQVITNFPHNWISSMWGPDCKLGMYVLWTIESIRAVEINSEYLIGRFPSQNPVLALRDSDELDIVLDNESHEIAAKAYFDWWEDNKHKDFDEFKSIDPLLNTEFRWH